MEAVAYLKRSLWFGSATSLRLHLLNLSLLFLLSSQAQGIDNRDIRRLKSDSDFNKIRLQWQYDRIDEDIFDGFRVTYCEDQSWGPHRCRNAMFKAEDLDQKLLKDGRVQYSGQVAHLRMATNYTLEVTPIVANSMAGPGGRSPNAKARAIADIGHSAQVFVATKGFSARAVSCLTNSTLVEVETGPHFGGKISVEGSSDPNCATHGKSKDSVSKYRLNIDHAVCGSKMVNDSVRTYIVVQENLPILTHSTRRFMVVCHYIPEAFTVSAGVRLPGSEDPLVPVDQTVNEVDPSELFDTTNDLFNGRKFNSRTGKALKFKSSEAENEVEGPGAWTQMVLMLVLVVGGMCGLSCAFWHFGRHVGVAAAIRRGLASRVSSNSSEVMTNNHHTTVIVTDMLDPFPSLSDTDHTDGGGSEAGDDPAEQLEASQDEEETVGTEELQPPGEKEEEGRAREVSVEDVSDKVEVSASVVTNGNWQKFEDYDQDDIIIV